MEDAKKEVIYKPAWRSYYRHIALMLLIFVAMCALTLWSPLSGKLKGILWAVALAAMLVIFLNMMVKRIGSILIVRNEEIAYEKGILKRNSTEIGLTSIRTVLVTQTLVQRILNIGDISIASSGTEAYEVQIENMPAPYAIRDDIQARSRVFTQPQPKPKSAEGDAAPAGEPQGA
ncbi:MAG: PH domain-containing protein [Fretibacterium sp.]|nr:PH domain-containing protein [Fretibacterium sp.]